MPAAPDLLSYSLALKFAIPLQAAIDKNDRVPKERALCERRRRREACPVKPNSIARSPC